MRDGEEHARMLAKGFRSALTKAEVILWRHLRRNSLGHKFRRQHPIGPYVADFACAQQRLVIEVDGATHRTPEELAHDARRTAFLNAEGWHVLRITNLDVYENMDGVWRAIMDALPPPSAAARRPPPP
ncbi:MAG TPA: endonuclease domain-containing protein [Caulobacterales bacterium]|nr:endonuclease domain-containing protein [Caulobacterales bacterium]